MRPTVLAVLIAFALPAAASAQVANLHSGAITAAVQRAIDDPARKKLIVLHTLGSHWNYSHRYPKAFDKWQPSLFGIENPAYTDVAMKPQLNNSYDNSILYTD